MSDKDPKKEYPQPPYPAQSQSYPGEESAMEPEPESGEKIYKGCNKLAGKVAIITGGDSGIGRSIAIAYAKEGADIVISYLSEDQDAEETKLAVEEAGKRCISIKGDIGEEEHCHNIINKTIETFGKINILVNNAAYQMAHHSIDEYSKEELDKTYKTNVYAMFYLTKYAFSHMPAGSSIINTTSIQAYQPSESLLAYATTKAAILNFTRGFAREAIKKGIRVNAVAPGPVWTPLIPSTFKDPKKAAEFGKDSLFGRPAQPIELAPVYVFLASDEASYVTAQTYGVTGRGMP